MERDVTPRAEAVIDLGVLRSNLDYLSGPACGSADVARMVIVKADAYGHGAAPVARVAREAGIPWLGVALPSEAMDLRQAGDQGRILAWLYAPGDPLLVDCVAHGVDLGVGSLGMLADVAAAARSAGRDARVHLKVDTGLGRGGCSPGQWSELVEAVSAQPHVEVVGIWSHLASADVPDARETDDQIAAFERAVAQAESLGVRPQMRHLASSGAALTRPDTHYDLVRLGIATYGVTPGPAIDMGPLRPAMTLRATVAATKRVPAGHGVSYGLTWRAPTSTTLALVPLGYADGLPRTARAPEVTVEGHRYPIVGRIAMDQVVIDVGDAPVTAGDEVTVWGPGTSGEPTAQEWAAWDDTIGYEIVTRVGARVPRRYVEE
jgi:alanine racemase